jgi:hypothetical protein
LARIFPNLQDFFKFRFHFNKTTLLFLWATVSAQICSLYFHGLEPAGMKVGPEGCLIE